MLQVAVLFDAPPDLSDNARCLIPCAPSVGYYRHLGVFGRELVHMRQQSHHTKETGYGKYVDGCRRLLADIDLLVGDVVHDGESLRRSLSVNLSVNCGECPMCRVCGGRRSYSSYTNPTWEEEARIFKTTCGGENDLGKIGVADVCCEKSDHGRLRSVVDEPVYWSIWCCVARPI